MWADGQKLYINFLKAQTDLKKKVNMKGVECPSFLLHLMMKKLRSCMKKSEHA